MTETGFSASPQYKAARWRVVDMNSLGSVRKREGKNASKQLTVSNMQAILKRLKICVYTNCYKA